MTHSKSYVEHTCARLRVVNSGKGLGKISAPTRDPNQTEKHTGTFIKCSQREANYIQERNSFQNRWWGGGAKKGLVQGTLRKAHSITLTSSPLCLSKSSQQLATIKGRSCGDLTCSQSLHLQSSWG